MLMRYLTIQKKYYDEILRGEKTREWRGINSRTRFLLDYSHEHIAFHYYKKNRLICEVKKIRHVKTPKRLIGQHGILDMVICIELGFVFERMKK